MVDRALHGYQRYADGPCRLRAQKMVDRGNVEFRLVAADRQKRHDAGPPVVANTIIGDLACVVTEAVTETVTEAGKNRGRRPS